MREIGMFARLLLSLGLLATAASGPHAQTPPAGAQAPAGDPLRKGADALVGLFNGGTEPEALFAPEFLAQVPAAQVKAIIGGVRAQLGRADRVETFTPEGPSAGRVTLAFERGTATLRLVVGGATSDRIVGLLITGTTLRGDDLAALASEFAALPGRAGFTIARLGDGAAPVAGREAARPFALGSVFKLYILAELVRQVNAGERRWSDTVPLGPRSLPSGITQAWPPASPMTLHSLATLMISVSDNTATDTLLAALGREKVEAIVGATGHADPKLNRPFLSTHELFVLKGDGGGAYLDRWLRADEAGRRALLPELARVDRTRFAYGTFSGPPKAIDKAEWFASPTDVARLLDWIRTHDRDGTARAILAVNQGGAVTTGASYQGFKGGSEPGVIAASYLVQAKGGQWYAVAGMWNDVAAPVDQARFIGLMNRALALAVAPSAPSPAR